MYQTLIALSTYIIFLSVENVKISMQVSNRQLFQYNDIETTFLFEKLFLTEIFPTAHLLRTKVLKICSRRMLQLLLLLLLTSTSALE